MREIRRERKEALADGVEIELLSSSGIAERHWHAFFGFYMDTGSRKSGTPYLNREFFSRIGASMSKHILLVMAKRNGHYIAGALNFIGEGTLYGRYWGAIEAHPFLHFEVLVLSGDRVRPRPGLSRVEAGAPGEHRLARGYHAAETYSAFGARNR